jgi:hypothetical protein
MAGTAGNLGWAESGVNVPVEPGDALKADGYAVNEIPTSAHWNWLLREHGRAAVRRFDTTEELIRARRSGTGGGTETGEDVGIVYQFYALGGYIPPPWHSTASWSHAVSAAVPGDLLSDGEYVWMTDGVPGAWTLRCRNRQSGASVASSADTFWYPVIATAGGVVYTLHAAGGTIVIQARDRVTLAVSYSFDTGLATGTVPQAIATDGALVAFVRGTFVYLFQDEVVLGTGATLSDVDNEDHGQNLFCVAMDGSRCIVGGVDNGGVQIRVYTTSTAALTPVVSLNRGAATVYRVDTDGQRILWCGDAPVAPDPEAGHYAGMFISIHETTSVWYWDLPVLDAGKNGDAKICGDKVAFAAFNVFSVMLADLATGKCIGNLDWGAAVMPHWLAWDCDALFVAGEDDGTGKYLKRYESRNQPALFAVQESPFSLGRGVHSLVQPVR